MKALLSLLLLCSAFAFGQRRVNVDEVTLQAGSFFQTANGTPVNTNIYYKVVEGSAFFKDEWLKGSAAIKNEKKYQNLTLRLNLLANQLHFQDDKGNEMISNTPINMVTLTDAAGRSYQFVRSSAIPAMQELKQDVWLESLAEGRAELYAHHKKSISESRPYGSATLEQRINTVYIFYLVSNNKLIRVKKLQDIVEAFPEKKKELQQWLRENDVERNQEGLTKLVQYYNSLN